MIHSAVFPAACDAILLSLPGLYIQQLERSTEADCIRVPPEGISDRRCWLPLQALLASTVKTQVLVGFVSMAEDVAVAFRCSIMCDQRLLCLLHTTFI